MSSSTDRSGTRSHPLGAAEARAEVEAARADRSAARRAQLDAAFAGGVPGRYVGWASWVGTAALTAVSVAAVVDPDRFLAAFFSTCAILFVSGAVVFALDIVLAAARSRDDLMGIGGLFFLAGSAPRTVQLSLNASLAAAVVVSLAATLSRLSTPELAFATLVPLFQLAMTGLWGVRHGHFPPQEHQGTRQRR